MSNTTKNPEVMNDLLENIIIGLLDQAQGEFEDRSGKVIKLKGLQKLKLDMVKKGVEIAFNRIGTGNAQAKFDLIVKLTNEHLPYVINTLGEDAIVNRIEKMPEDVRDQEVIEALEEAGATELAGLLRKAMPELAVAVAAPAVVPEVTETVEITVKAPEVEETGAEVQSEVAPSREQPEVKPSPVRSKADSGVTMETLREQLSVMKRFQAMANNAVKTLEGAIDTLEEQQQSAKPGKPAIEPPVKTL